MKKAIVVLCITSVVVACIAWMNMPDQIPAHFNAAGEVDRYGSRFEIFMIPLLSIVLTLSFIALSHTKRLKDTIARFTNAYESVLFGMNLLFFSLLLIIITETFQPGTLDINRIMIVALSVMFIIVGNLMPKFKTNGVIGIRTSWTLQDETTWFKTHRFGGKIWFYGGIVSMLGIFLPSQYGMLYIIGVTLLLAILPCIYSYYCFKQQLHSKGE